MKFTLIFTPPAEGGYSQYEVDLNGRVSRVKTPRGAGQAVIEVPDDTMTLNVKLRAVSDIGRVGRSAEANFTVGEPSPPSALSLRLLPGAS